jgi:RNA polymerase sigma factor (sigma-70 family)
MWPPFAVPLFAERPGNRSRGGKDRPIAASAWARSDARKPMSPRISISLLAAQSDQRLLALARDGHERAFEALVQRYGRPLLRYCRRIGLSDTRAEDVLQQSFLQAWLALAGGVEVRELRSWLYRIVHNTAVNAMRGAAESHSELTEAVQARASLAGESNLERTIAVREALGEVAELPQMQRAAIFLTAVDGQTHEEVASALGISHGALRGLLYRARTTLRSAAAALTPPPLLQWASGGSGVAAPSAERLAELTAGGGAAGLAGVLLKGAVVAVTAGALATGAGVVANHRHGAASPRRGTPIAAPIVAVPGASADSAVAVRALPMVSGERGSTRGRHGAARQHGEARQRDAHRIGRRRDPEGNPAGGGSPGNDGDRDGRGDSLVGDRKTSAKDEREDGREVAGSDGPSSASGGAGGSPGGSRRKSPAGDGGTGTSSGSSGDGRSGTTAPPSEQTRGGGEGLSSASGRGVEQADIGASGLDATGAQSPSSGQSSSGASTPAAGLTDGSDGSAVHGGPGSDG